MRLRFVNARQDGGARLLRALRLAIGDAEVAALGALAGLEEPNTFTLGRLTGPLISGAFPDTDFFEFMWAINESPTAQIRALPLASRLYLCAVYVYCNKQHSWSVTAESSYFFELVRPLSHPEGSSWRGFVRDFLEWLHEFVTPTDDYDDYWCLVAWSICRLADRQDGDNSVHDVVASLESRRLSAEDLSLMTVSDEDPERWVGLLNEFDISDDAGVKARLKAVLIGA